MHIRHAALGCLLILCCKHATAECRALRERREEELAMNTSRSFASSITGLASTTLAHPTPVTPTTTSVHVETSVALDADKLPVQPTITPAIGIAGVILVLTGLTYTLISIKHQWLAILFGSAYLASLAVTVSVIFLMNPPISDAIQGAYLIAAVMGGLVFASLSLMFKEATEGLSCLLGGFCFSMWLLVLRPGGLLVTGPGKAVLISLVSIGAWCLSFITHTRHYGMMVCTSFAGATATILGVDCFSRAGLKEFWIYIWNLNKDEFPPHTTTYPVTRGITAETACIVVLSLVGVVSQSKIWKFVKERKAGVQEEGWNIASHRNEYDSQLGLGIEAGKTRSMAGWEAIYSDNGSSELRASSNPESSMDSLRLNATATEYELRDVWTDVAGGGKHNARATALEVSDADQTPMSDAMGSQPGDTGAGTRVPAQSCSRSGSDKRVSSLSDSDGLERRASSPDVASTENISDSRNSTTLIGRFPKISSSGCRGKTENMRISTSPAPESDQTSPALSESKYVGPSRDSLKPFRQSIADGVSRRMFSTPSLVLPRQRNSASSLEHNAGARHASMPLIRETLVESPIEQDFAVGDTLLNQRKARLDRRPTSVNFNALLPRSNSQLVSPIGSLGGHAGRLEPDIDMPLSQRKRMIQQGQISISSDGSSVASTRRTTHSGPSSVSGDPASPWTSEPRRSATSTIAQQKVALADRRPSPHRAPSNRPLTIGEELVRNAPSGQQTSPMVQYAQQARQSMAEQLRFQDHQQQTQQTDRKNRESQAEMAMRTGQMTSLHRSALSKMQQQANEALRASDAR